MIHIIYILHTVHMKSAATWELCSDVGAVQRRGSCAATWELCSDVGAVQRCGSCAATWELCSDVGVVQRCGSCAATWELCSAISSLGTGPVLCGAPLTELNPPFDDILGIPGDMSPVTESQNTLNSVSIVG